MDARRAIQITNEVVNVKPFVVLVARTLPPGRRRLEMVKLALELDYRRARVPGMDVLKAAGWGLGRRPQSQPAPGGRRLGDDRVEQATKLEFEQPVEVIHL
jgi:hypothetical protein